MFLSGYMPTEGTSHPEINDSNIDLSAHVVDSGIVDTFSGLFKTPCPLRQDENAEFAKPALIDRFWENADCISRRIGFLPRLNYHVSGAK